MKTFEYLLLILAVGICGCAMVTGNPNTTMLQIMNESDLCSNSTNWTTESCNQFCNPTNGYTVNNVAQCEADCVATIQSTTVLSQDTGGHVSGNSWISQ